MKFKAWILIAFYLSPLYFFHWVLEILSFLWFYDFCFFILWKTLLSLGLKTKPRFDPHGNLSLKILRKIIETSFFLTFTWHLTCIFEVAFPIYKGENWGWYFKPKTFPEYQVFLTKKTWSILMMLASQLSENLQTQISAFVWKKMIIHEIYSENSLENLRWFSLDFYELPDIGMHLGNLWWTSYFAFNLLVFSP